MTGIYNVLNRILQVISAILFALLVLATTWQVFSRLVLNSPVTWSEELAKMLFVWLSFLGAALVYGERGHMAVEYLARKFADATERKIAIFTHVIAFIFAALVFVWGGWNAAMNAWSQNLTGLPVNIGSVYLVIPLAGVAICLYAIYHIIEISAGRESNYPVPEAEKAAEEGEKMAAEADKDIQLDDDRHRVEDSMAAHADAGGDAPVNGATSKKGADK